MTGRPDDAGPMKGALRCAFVVDGLCSGRCSHRPTSRGSRGEGRRLRANAATAATTARPAAAPHIEAGDGRPAGGRVLVGGRLARPVVALPSASSMERPMLASADEPRFTWRRPAFASKRRYGSNDSAPGGRAPHRGGRRPPCRRSRSTSKQGLVFHLWGSRAARAVSYSPRAFSRATGSCWRRRWAARTNTMRRLG